MQTSLNFPPRVTSSSSSSSISKKIWHSSQKHKSVSATEYQIKQKQHSTQQKSSTISTEEHRKKEQDSLHASTKTNNNDDDDNERSEEVAHTDGSSLGNQFKATRKAGYSVFFGEGDPRNRSEPVEGDKHTNNVGELMGVITALELANKEKNLTVFTDSEYVIKGIAGMNGKPAYIINWLKNGWRTAKREPVKNKALWVSSVVPLHHELINNYFTNIIFNFSLYVVMQRRNVAVGTITCNQKVT